MGWLRKAIRWIGIALRLIKATEKELSPPDKKKPDCDGDHDGT